MAKRLSAPILSKFNNIFNKTIIENICRDGFSRGIQYSTKVPVKEIKIPTAWGGQIAAKLWGKENEQPTLALHGWQDNAGTWDPLAPMLCEKRPILAIDFPGHGFSSWIPKGVHYYAWDFARIILYIKEHFKWNKISLLGHSMGSIAAMRFASVYPDDVDFYIAIDSLIYDDYDLNLVVGNFPKILKKIEIAQERLDTQPPCYTKEEMSKKWHLGTKKSVSLESVHYLIERGAKPSPTEPNKLYFSRDPRLKTPLFCPEDKKLVEALITRLKCPTLYIKGKESPYATDHYSVEMREIIAKNNSIFECHFVPGTHHLHLNTPELILPHIENFLIKHNFLEK